ncbi:MAG: M1 family peptidase, partial [Pseudomonadota bacterium]|nr:M1 family peptidase [Pseudomonadota bacterium]
MQAILRSSCAAAVLCTVPVRAADFDPKAAFAAQPLPEGVNVYRSSNGAPGPGYWQNRVDYAITARIDATAKTLTATETVDYTNNSPDTLPSLWMQLDQNIYLPDSRAATMGGGR